MKQVQNWLYCLKHINFKWKLVSAYSLVMAATSVIVAFMFYHIFINQVINNSKDMTNEILKKNIQILDEKLIKIKENSAQVVVDYELCSYLRDEEDLVKKNYLGLDRKITQILYQYFPFDDVDSVQLITDQNIYGVTNNLLTADRFRKSSICQEILEQKGALIWIPVYDIVDMFHLEQYRQSALPNRRVFSAARAMGNGYIDREGSFEAMSLDGVSKPVLLINFSESVIDNVFKESMPVQGAGTYLLSPDGEIIYFSGENYQDAEIMSELYEQIKESDNGSTVLSLNGKETMISYMTSQVTGWISVILIPSSELMRTARVQIKVTMGAVILGAILLGILLSIIISSMVARPIHKTVAAMQKLGIGQFDVELPVESKDEFGYLVEGFNIMNKRITRLIEDNYESRLRENEMEIMALNLQLNPHFLYNTLTVINYEALDAGCEKVSDIIMHLCDMLNYTFRNNNETSSLREDMAWVRSYVDIMMCRFENRFEVFYDIPENLMDLNVPKLFLQPFIENAILHGFEFMDAGGVIEVSGRKENGCCIIEVSDNGVGMERPEEKMDVKQTSGSIGIANVQQRIKLLYGVDYGVKMYSKIGQGTRVVIKLPDNIEHKSTF